MLRIIAGERRGHKFEGPEPESPLRPTSDMVREALFNILDGLVVDRMVIDLFAGTGALGFEALSRGARRALFIERDRKSASLIYKNIATLRYEDRAGVRLADAYRVGASLPEIAAEPVVVLLDPPYRDQERKPRRVYELNAALMERVAPGSVLAVETGRAPDERILPRVEEWDVRRYGNTRIAIWLKPAAGGAARPTALDLATLASTPARAFALEVVRRLRAAGYQALWAGGCVRDLLLGQEPADYDVATDARPDQAIAALGLRAIEVGASFGVVKVLDPSRPGEGVEVATFRGDGVYTDGRRPASVTFGSAEIDAARRDFTINGVFYDPIENHVIDYVGGRADLEARLLRAIGDPAARFREDELRVLRAVRFAARFELRIEPVTRAAIQSHAPRLSTVSAERVAQELRRMLVHRSRVRALDLTLETGLATAVMPPLTRLRGLFVGPPAQPEADVWDHTLAVLDLLPAEPGFPLAFAALLHDVGKPDARRAGSPTDRFPNHPQIGAAITDQLARSLRLSTAERTAAVWLVANHQVLWSARSLRDSQLKRILAAPLAGDLLALHRADALAAIGSADHVNYCEAYLHHPPHGPIDPPPLVSGHDLLAMGLKAGPRFATLLEAVRDRQLDGEFATREQALDWLAREIVRPPDALPGTSPRI